ncbi:MAG: YncE family protein [Nitrososphaeraceae archaeon]
MKKKVLVISLLSIFLYFGTMFNLSLSLTEKEKSILSYLTNSNIGIAFAQENNYYYEDDDGYYYVYKNNDRLYENYDNSINEDDYNNSYEPDKKEENKNRPVIIIENKIPIPYKDKPLFCDDHNYGNDYDQNEKCLIECSDSGFIVTDETNCPQKCPDGTYIMQGMECPFTGLNVTKNWFVCDIEDTIDCIIEPQQEGEQISFETSDSGNYAQCTEDNDCPFVSDAGFEIIVNGTNPTPSTFPALINTIQDVELGAGPYQVSELLSFEQIVENAIINVENVGVGDIEFFSLPTFPLAFDSAGQRVFTANFLSDSVSIIDLNNNNAVTDVDLLASGGENSFAIAFDSAGQRVFTANAGSSSVSIVDLNNNNAVTDVDLLASGGVLPFAIAFDSAGQRVFTANFDSDSVSIIDLNNNNAVTDVDLFASGGDAPIAIAFDSDGQRVFTANDISNSVSIIDLPSVSKICQDSGFDTGDIRTFSSGQEILQQTTCVNFSEQCTGEIMIQDTETQQCIIDDYVVLANVLP